MPTVTGTSADETLTGTDDADELTGNGGYDTLIGRGGNDVLDGFGVMAGGEGDDRFLLRITNAGGREGLLTGGDGVDTIDLGLILVPAVNSATIGIARVVADGEDILATLATTGFRSPQIVNVNWSVRANGIERIIGFAGLTPTTSGSIAYDFTGRNSAIEIFGGAGREIIRGGAGADLLDGGAGDDDIYVGRGDRAFGGTGNDNLAVMSSDLTFVGSIDGGGGSDTLFITLNSALSGFDLRTGGSVAAPIREMESVSLVQSTSYANQSVVMTLTGDAGDNALSFSREAGAAAVATNIVFRAGAGNDVVTSSGTDDSLYGEAGNDQLTGTGLLDGGVGNDVLSGNGRLLGGDGDDQITVRSTRTFTTSTVVSVGTNEVVGGAGIDTFRLDTNYDQVISLRTGTATATPNTGNSFFQGTITLSGIENVIGGDARDRIEGDDGVNEIRGGYGPDILRGGGGDDILHAYGATGTSFDTSADQLYGEDGDDLMYGNYGSDTLDGGAGDDIAYGSGGNDTLLGGDGDDVLYGEEDGDRLEGGAGADRLDGGSSADTLIGGAGDDVLTGGSGSDVIDGGDGMDIARFDFSVELATFTYEGAFIRVAVPGDSDLLTGIERLVFNDAVLTVGADGRIVATRPAAINGTQNADVLNGTAGDDFIIGLGAADVIRGGAGNDALSGGAGSDLLYGGSGINVLDGGDGSDTAGYSGTSGSYSAVSRTYVGGGIEGARDSLTSIEALRFLDGRLSFDINDVSTAVYRLYDAAFDRAPDVFGLADYSRAITEGRANLQSIQEAFAGSAEFQARYGALNNEQFVREMYRFSLNREGEAAGVASYVTALDNGTTTRAQVLGIFSESQEHRAQINAVITTQGLFVQDEQTASVARLYDSVFNRLPDLGGLRGYRDALDAGYTLKDVATVLIGSPEFQTRFGSLTNQQFVEQIYRFVLDREGDAAGVQSYVQALNNGFTRTDVVMVLSDSQEHRLSYQATYDSQIRRLGVDGYDPSGSGVGRAIAEPSEKHMDAFVLPADPTFDAAHDDAVAAPETAANDHGLPDLLPVDQWMLLDFMVPTDDLSGGHHRSDWM